MKIGFDEGSCETKVDYFKPENNLSEYMVITDELKKISLDTIDSKMEEIKAKLSKSKISNVLNYNKFKVKGDSNE